MIEYSGNKDKECLIMVDYIIKAIDNYGLIAITLVITLEYACFPVPSEIVLPLSGAVAAQGSFSFLAVYLLSILAGLAGSYICYCIGRFGGVPLLKKLENRFPKFHAGIQFAKEKFEKYSTLSVGFGRVIPLCRTYISFVAGLAEQNILIFTAASAAGIGIWNAILVGLGYLLSSNWQIVAQYYDKFKWVMLFGAILLVVAYILLKRYFNKKEDEALERAKLEEEKKQDE
ncbi:MAG: DedA family protein [Clostridia bacterium]|nr:DedA family protein [Clostridia bacterium]